MRGMATPLGEGPAAAREDSRWVWAGIWTAVAAGLVMTARVWGPHPQAGDDIDGQLAWSEFAISHLWRHGQVDGWFPGFMLGYQKFFAYGPGFSLVVAFTRLVSLGLLSTTGATKVVTVVA